MLRASAVLLAAALVVPLLVVGPLTDQVRAEAPTAAAPGGAQVAATAKQTPLKFFKICKNQTYALCATASCTVLNQVAYCTCKVKTGDSISLPLKVGGEDVCSINAKGADNGYMVSTFSDPESVRAPRGDRALYTCPGTISHGAYAQCDGGICFKSTEGGVVPGSNEKVGPGEIVCACPITVPTMAPGIGHQIAGPYPCDPSFYRYCTAEVANIRTGSTVMVGAPTGTARFLARRLYGEVPPLHVCPEPARGK
jgi:hypothetical protein